MAGTRRKSSPTPKTFVRPASTHLERGRIPQKLRTRKALLEAAAVLLKRGITPSVAEAAKMAGVSRATAYRYFPSADLLLIEAPFELAVPSPAKIFGPRESSLPRVEDRLDAMGRALHGVWLRDDAKIRLFLRIAMDRALARSQAGVEVPLRQGRRVQLIDAALRPIRQALSQSQYKMLSAALAMVVGIESAVALTDVLRLSEREVKSVKSWAARTLVTAALQDASRRHGGAAGKPPRSRKKV